jgi:hypothetical protein
VRAHFPSWGPGARITLHRRDGISAAAADGAQLADVAWIHVQSRDSGYVIVPVGRFPRARARLLRPSKQDSNPSPGPTLAFELLDHARLRRLVLRVRIAPARDADAAVAVAARLLA